MATAAGAQAGSIGSGDSLQASLGGGTATSGTENSNYGGDVSYGTATDAGSGFSGTQWALMLVAIAAVVWIGHKLGSK